METKDEDEEGRGYTFLDLEGHVGNFGSYDPRASAWPDLQRPPRRGTAIP